ncbi:MAG: hypothetical protein PVI86_08365 [Phycisphaerae bacterium]|jgi:hypothetical protein
MPDIDLNRVRRLWRETDDADVARALAMRNDYVPEAYAIVAEEAARRGVGAAMADAHAPSGPGPGGVILRAIAGFIKARALLSGCLGGAGLRLGLNVLLLLTESFHWAVWVSLYVVLACVVLCVVGWPLRKCRAVVLGAAGAFVGNLAVAGVFLVMYLEIFRRIGFLGAALSNLANGVVVWGIPCLLVCGVVKVRNLLHPVYEPGFCANCGYNLRGLPEPRCPECGEPFDRVNENLKTQA